MITSSEKDRKRSSRGSLVIEGREAAINSSVWVTAPEFSGYLFKKGFAWRKLWKRRWVALYGTEIAYMEGEPQTNNSYEQYVIGTAKITSETVLVRDDIEGHAYGFSIRINDGVSPTWYLRAESLREKMSWLVRLSHVTTIAKWLDGFEKLRLLGLGGTGTVHELLEKSTGRRFAMKEIEIQSRQHMARAMEEAETLLAITEKIRHKNVLNIEKVFQVGSKFFMMFPVCLGGELYDHVVKRGAFRECDAALILRDILSGLDALHKNQILHLDIKPENLLFDTDQPDACIKITDFGLSRCLDEEASVDEAKPMPSYDEMQNALQGFLQYGNRNSKIRGTVGYMSPELILNGHSSTAADVFAAGVVLFILLCGKPPFNHHSSRMILELTARGKHYSMQGQDWALVSEEATDLVQRMICHDPNKRISVEDALKHPWFFLELGVDALSQPSSSPPSPPTPHPIHNSASRAKRVAVVPTEPAAPLLGPTLAPPQKPRHDAGSVSTIATTRAAAAAVHSSVSSNLSGRRSVHNLSLAMSNLSTHLSRVRTQKAVLEIDPSLGENMDTTSTVAGAAAAGGVGRGFGAVRLYRLLESTRVQYKGAENSAGKMRIRFLHSNDSQNALTKALTRLGECIDGNLSIAQFVALVKYIAFVLGNAGHEDRSIFSASSSSASSGTASRSAVDTGAMASFSKAMHTAATMLARFVDRDGDGTISPADLFASYGLILQRNGDFMRMLFRIYVEAVWYPGRKMNQTFAIHEPGENKTKNKKVLAVRTNNDTFAPPKVINVTHVAAIFDSLGLRADSGQPQKIFYILCGALVRQNQLHKAPFVVSPIKEGDDEDDDEDDKGDKEPAESSPVKAANLSNAADISSPASSSNFLFPSSDSYESLGLGKKEIDVKEFIRVAEIDDVLVQVLLKHVTEGIFTLFCRCEDRLEALQYCTQTPLELKLQAEEGKTAWSSGEEDASSSSTAAPSSSSAPISGMHSVTPPHMVGHLEDLLLQELDRGLNIMGQRSTQGQNAQQHDVFSFAASLGALATRLSSGFGG